MKKVIVLLSVLSSLSMVASDSGLVVDDQKLQKQVEQVLLEEIFAADGILRKGLHPYTSDSIAQKGDLAGVGVCAFLSQGYFSIKANESNIVLCRQQIFGKKDNATGYKVLNQWVARSIKSKGFTVTCKRRGPYNHHPVQSMCVDEQSNPQVKCNVYDPARGNCWTDFKLTVSKEVFAGSRAAYFASLLKSNLSAEQKNNIEKRMQILS